MAEKMASGIDVHTITMLRQLPRNKTTISDTSSDEMIASRTTPRDGAAHEQRLIEVDLQLEPVGRRRLDGRQRVAHGVDHRQRRRVRVLEDRQIRGALAVDAHDVGLVGERVGDVRDVAQDHRRAVDDLDRDAREVGDVGAGWR